MQLWAKPQPNDAVAAFVVNHNSTTVGGESVVLDFNELFSDFDEGREEVLVRDLYETNDVGTKSEPSCNRNQE